MTSTDFYRRSRLPLSPQRKKPILTQLKLPSLRALQDKPAPVKYILGDSIGEGAFGKVRTCLRRSDNLPFVIKTFQKYRLLTTEKVNAVKAEIEMLKCIEHPCIIGLIDSFETRETINIVMEDFSHTSLAVFSRKYRPLQIEVIHKIALQMAQAISYMHSRQIAHRDLKPENILINDHHEIKIIDLGLACIGEHLQLQYGGTLQYMSPQLVHKKNYDPFKADIWAFGITLYWLILGYFPQDNEEKRKRKHHTNGKLFELKFPADMHPGVEYLITRMLDEDANERMTAEGILKDTWICPRNLKSQISKLMQVMSRKQI